MTSSSKVTETLKRVFDAVTAAEARHNELKAYLVSVCEDFRFQAHQAGIPMTFTLSLTPSIQPDKVRVSIDIEKGRWPHRKLANVQIREREEGEISNYVYSVRYQTGHEVNRAFTGFRRDLHDDGPFREELRKNLYNLFCEKILDANEFSGLRKLLANAQSITPKELNL